jgi:hypothetical protein
LSHIFANNHGGANENLSCSVFLLFLAKYKNLALIFFAISGEKQKSSLIFEGEFMQPFVT